MRSASDSWIIDRAGLKQLLSVYMHCQPGTSSPIAWQDFYFLAPGLWRNFSKIGALIIQDGTDLVGQRSRQVLRSLRTWRQRTLFAPDLTSELQKAIGSADTEMNRFMVKQTRGIADAIGARRPLRRC